MAKKIVALLALMVVAFLLGGCLGENSSSTNSVAQAAESTGPKGLQKTGFGQPASPTLVEQDGWRYANPLCVPDENPFVDCIASRNDKFLRNYTGGKEWRLEWIRDNNSRAVIPANAGHDHVIPARTWIAHKKRGDR